MTITATPSEIPYAGNGVTLSFAIPFVFDTSADLKVYSTVTATGVITQITTGFTVTGGDGATGNILFAAAPAATVTITIIDDPALTQPADYISNDAFPAETHEDALDRVTRIAKRLYQTDQKALRVPDGDASSGNDLLLPTLGLRKSNFLVFDAIGNVSVSAGTGADAGLRADLANTDTAGKGNELISYRITLAENDALVTPTNYSLPPGNVLRYGTNALPGMTDMLTAFQNAVLQAEAGGAPVYVPPGTYYSSAAIELKHTASYFSEDTGIHIYGAGIATKLTRGSVNGVASATDGTAAGQSFFRCHGSNNIIENLRFYDCDVCIYFGQDPDIAYGTAPSSVCFNRIRKLWLDQCGTGLLVTAAGGTHYNDFDSIHAYECQIGIHLRKGAWTGSVANVNRNTFKNVRAARCYVGVLITNGGTNSFYSVHAEGCNSTPTNNTRAYPTGLPAAVGTDGVGIMMDGFGEVSDNQFFGCTHESCDYFVYNDAYNSQFYGCKFQDSSAANNIFVVPPGVLISETSFVLDGTFTKLGNSLTLGFDATRPAGINHSEEPAWYHGYTRQLEGNAYKSERMVQAGAIASSGTATVTIQPEESGFQETSSFILSIDIIGDCTASTLTHYKQCKVIGQRNSSRTLTRYYLFDEVAGRATGTPAGDATEPFTLALAVSSKDLQLAITAPARDFASVTVRITDVVTRA